MKTTIAIMIMSTLVMGHAAAQQPHAMAAMAMKTMDMSMPMMMPSASDPASTAGYKAAMMKMMRGAPAFSGNADADFMTQMRVHHIAAIDMANVLLATGKNAETKKLARAIVTAQEAEISTIDAWLRKNGS